MRMRPPSYPKFPATLQAAPSIRPAPEVSVSEQIRRAKEALAQPGVRDMLLAYYDPQPVTGQYYDLIRAGQQVRTRAPVALTDPFVRGIQNKVGNVKSFQAASYNYPSGQMVIGAALAGVMQRTGLSLSALRMLSPEARRRLSPLDRQYIPSLMVAQRLEMGRAFLRASSAAQGVPTGGSMMLGYLGAADCDPSIESCPDQTQSRESLDARAKKAQAELKKATKDKKSGAKVKQATQERAATKVTEEAAKKAPPATSTFSQFSQAMAGPLNTFFASLGREIGEALGEVMKELIREAVVAAKCGINGYDYCDAQSAMNAVRAELAESWGGGSAAALDFFFKRQSKQEINQYRICDNDGEQPLNCEDFDATFGSDKANDSGDFVRNEGALKARTMQCADNKSLRDRLGLLTDEDRAAILRYAVLQASLVWIAAQTSPSALDPFVISQDPNFQALTSEQQGFLTRKVEERKSELRGEAPPAAGAGMGMGTVAIVVGALAVAGGAYYFLKMRKPA